MARAEAERGAARPRASFFSYAYVTYIPTYILFPYLCINVIKYREEKNRGTFFFHNFSKGSL